jgi:hypothetical protein
VGERAVAKLGAQGSKLGAPRRVPLPRDRAVADGGSGDQLVEVFSGTPETIVKGASNGPESDAVGDRGGAVLLNLAIFLPLELSVWGAPYKIRATSRATREQLSNGNVGDERAAGVEPDGELGLVKVKWVKAFQHHVALFLANGGNAVSVNTDDVEEVANLSEARHEACCTGHCHEEELQGVMTTRPKARRAIFGVQPTRVKHQEH